MVSPGNPLKPTKGMAPLAERLASAARIADGRQIRATAIEAGLGTRFTADTLAVLARRFPRVSFVFLIGADNLAQLPRWQRWRSMLRHTRLAVLPRPGFTRHALKGAAAAVLAPHRRRPGAMWGEGALGEAAVDRGHAPWCVVPAREHAASATAIRAAVAHGAAPA